ncbi:two-component regulator propeller domain-containing protein [Fulvivirgaceae bacterium BMA12]|uniref:histidine kinase n=1 Tax=Agaribacillus aureus TaxID=3051825 RepID=A0ABT8LAR2_9BACT|nr:two-component regulator propeller domain-containing protein [Fulvivirgaceae bacterium BMA12]
MPLIKRHLFLYLILHFWFMSAWSQVGNLRFTHLSVDQGLSQSTILSLEQDMMGFLWIGTADGLNRYDGYEFTNMRRDPDMPGSISDNEIMAILDDQKGNIWIGNAAGIDLLNVETEICQHFYFDPDSISSLSNNYVTVIFKDSNDDIWVGTAHGLNKFDSDNNTFTRYYITSPHLKEQNVIRSINQLSENKLLIGSGEGLYVFNIEKANFTRITDDQQPNTGINTYLINALVKDNDQNLWIGTNRGLFRYDSKLEKHYHYTSQNSRLSNDFIRCGLQRKDGTLWFGTENGLNQFDPAVSEFYEYRYQAGQPHSLSNNSIHSILEDNAGNLWVGTGSGLNRLDPFSFQFNPQLVQPHQQNDQVNNKVWAIHEHTGQLWIGTEGGLHILNRQQQAGTYPQTKTPLFDKLNDVIVRCIESNNREMWIGTEGEGLVTFSAGEQKLISYKTIENDSSSISDNIIRTIRAAPDNTLWIGTSHGLNHFHPITRKFQRFYFDSQDNALKINSIRDLRQDGDLLWIGTEDGLIRFDKLSGETTHFRHLPDDPGTLSHSFVRTIFIDQSGVLWVGTSGGLNKYDAASNSFKCYKTKDGLPNDVIYGILEDDNQHLWISTNRGLSHFNPRDETFFNYDVSDGLQSNEFNTNAVFKTDDGQMIFGGIRGLNIFDPESIRQSKFQTRILLTEFEILNKKADIGDDMPLRKSIMMADTVFLDYKDNLFTFRYSAINFISAPKTEYQYQLEGFDKNWNYVGQRRYATYTNIPGGKYRFRVKSSYNQRDWNEGLSIVIIVKSPFWEKPWFNWSAILLLAFLLFMFFRIRTQTIRNRNVKLQRLVEERTKTLEENKKALEESESLFRNIYEQSPIGIAYADKHSKVIIKCNPQFSKILGYTEAEIKGNRIGDFAYHDDQPEAETHKENKVAPFDESKFYYRKKRLTDKSGNTVYVTAAATMITDVSGEAKYQLIMLDNITEEQKAQEKLQKARGQLIQADKMASLGQLTAGVAHEINNPVNFIFNGINGLDKNLQQFLKIVGEYEQLNSDDNLKNQLAAILKKKESLNYDDLKKDIREMIPTIKEGAERAAQIVKSLQTFVWSADVDTVYEDIHKGLESTLLLLSNQLKNRIVVRKNFQADNPVMQCLPGQLNQVFMNIIINAIQVLKEREQGTIDIETRSDEKHIYISIADNGKGIPEKAKEKIFEPFYTTKPVGQGTGLGLSISYNIVREHGGSISVESEVNKGTKFTIKVPKNK